MAEKNIRTKIQNMVFAFLGIYGLGYLGRIAGMSTASFSLLTIPMFFSLYCAIERTGKDMEKRRAIYAEVISLLLSVSLIMGYQLQNYGMTDGGMKGKAGILLRGICLSVVFFPILNYAFSKIEGLNHVGAVKEESKIWKTASVFWVSVSVVFVCMIPVFLAYYPIIMSYDFHRQLNEAVKGFEWFYPYQPIAHTWIIWVALQLGNAIGSIEIGFACMALFQILCYSLVAGYACSFVYRVIPRKWVWLLTTLYFAVFPFHTVMVMCTTKDVLFSILFLLFFLILCELVFFAKGRKKIVLSVLFLLEGCLMMQFRNNALYAIAATVLILFLFAPKKEKLGILILGLLLVAGGIGTEALVKEAIGTELTISKREMYSVPIVQMARVGKYHKNSLEEDDFFELSNYVPWEYWEDYNPSISDSVKNSIDGWVEDLFGSGVIGTWAKFGMKYPNEYLDAFLELTRGYWFVDDTSWAEVLGYGTENRMGAIFTYNSSEIEGGGVIEHRSKFPWLESQLEKIVSGNAFFYWPIVSILFRCATYVWALLLLWVSALYLKKRRQMAILVLPLMYLGTLLLGPVAWLRYVFPFMLMIPVWIGMFFIPEGNEVENDELL